MSGIEQIPLIIPEQWSASWYRQHVAEVLAKLDTRNAIGDGIAISSDGNSVATLSANAAISSAVATHNADPAANPAAIAAHDALVTAHAPAFNAHRAETDPHPDLIDDLDAVTAVAEADYVLVSQSGTNKKATVDQLAAAVFGEDWDDLRFPMNSVDPAGIVGAATRITSLTGYTGALEFKGNAENVCAGIAQMPHAWKRGTAIRPHIHWTKPTGSANEVQWRLYLRVVGNPGDAVGAWSAALSPAGTVGDQTVSDEHLLTYWAPFAMTGLIESAILYWRLHRLGNTDADNSDVICHELDFHYQTDKAGTEDEIPTE
jgi:hypothetical protein